MTMALTTTALPKRFYKDALTKVKTFAEKGALMLFNLAVDLVVDAVGRDQRAEGIEPDWQDLRQQAKAALEDFDEAELRGLLSETFGLKTQEQMLERFGQIRDRKRQSSGYGGATSRPQGSAASDDLDDDFEDSLDEAFID